MIYPVSVTHLVCSVLDPDIAEKTAVACPDRFLQGDLTVIVFLPVVCQGFTLRRVFFFALIQASAQQCRKSQQTL